MMPEPQDISAFKDQLLSSDEIRALAATEWGNSANEKLISFEQGEQLNDLYALISDAKWGPYCENFGGPLGAAPDNDTFLIQIARIGPVFFISACEFDDLEFFGSADEADEYARDYFSSWIEQLKERQSEPDAG